jgi:hypothetical protein
MMAGDLVRKFELTTLDLHLGLNPLVEGKSTGNICTSISGMDRERLQRSSGAESAITEFPKRFSDTQKASTEVLPSGITIKTTFERPLLPILNIAINGTSVVADAQDRTLQVRQSTFRENLSPPNTIDTQIYAPDGRTLRGTIHSDFYPLSDQIDTIVKDAAGHELRRLTSSYETNMFQPDTLCTRLQNNG